MDLRSTLRVALRALARNKMRTTLTMLGIIIGVGAVICTVAIGDGASNQIREAIRNMGDNMVWIEAGSATLQGLHLGSLANKTLTADDTKAIEREVPLVVNVNAQADTRVQVVYGNQNWGTSLKGEGPQFFAVRRWPVETGSSFTEQDVIGSTNVCILGATVVDALFGGADPIGQTVRIKNLPFRVIGVMSRKGLSPSGGDQDDCIVTPYTTVQKKIKGSTWLDDIMCSAVSPEAIVPAQKQIRGLLRARHHLRPDAEDDFNIRIPSDLAQVQMKSAQVMTVLLVSIASVSLLVGGIGIMNIMLVSVTERTREIGIRMAVGASDRDVQIQFLSEAVALSIFGGSLGVLLGVLGSRIVANVLHWPIRVSLQAIGVAALFSAAVGIFFGYYPARKAAQLDPIEALRYE